MKQLRGPALLLSILVVLVTAALPLAAQDGVYVWGTVPSPNRGKLQNSLKGIHALSGSDAWAVGDFNPGIPPTATGRRTLTKHWDGTTWTLVASPNPRWEGLDLASLESVSGVASDDVWAVGYSEDFASLRLNTLTMHWDGTRWRQVQSPNPAGTDKPNQLLSVVAVSSTNVWAVGRQEVNGKPVTLQWNGVAWKAVRNNCGTLGTLRSVAAVSATDIWAVGDGVSCHYDGANWSSISIPASGFGADSLLGVSASASDNVWASGLSVYCQPDGGCTSISYVICWNGTKWQLMRNSPGASLNAVLVQGPNDVWSVGTNSMGTVVAHWDGSKWMTVPSPDPGSGGLLNAITATAPSQLLAAGSYFGNNFQDRTLILEAPSTSQGTILGETAYSGATISWIGAQNRSTQADVFGHYDAAGLPAGSYELVGTAPGCTPKSTSVSISPGKTTVQDFHFQCSQ